MKKEEKISRRKFMETSGNLLISGAGIALFSTLVASCGKDSPTSPGNDNSSSGEKKLVINLSENPALNSVGGFKTFKLGSTPVILFRISETTFRTLSLVCTHQGCTIGWTASANRFDCPCHGSQFDKSGNVLHGPASSSLETFRTEYDSMAGQVIIYY